MPAQAVVAQVGGSPDNSGPGSELIQQATNWLMSYGLWACLAAVLAGAALYALGQSSGSYGGGGTGKKMIIGGAAGAAIIGLGPSVINAVFNAT